MTALGGWRLVRDPRGHVRAQRGPGDLDAAMIGVAVAEAPTLAARLHALCPMAHAIAARTALEGAVEPSDPEILQRDVAASAALRIGLGWAAALGAPPDRDAVIARAAAERGDPLALADALERLTDGPLAEDMARRANEALSGVADPQRLERPLAERFSVMRVQSRALARACREGGIMVSIDAGPGWARVDTARGDLTVRLRAEGDAIVDYHADTPTGRLMASGGAAERVCAQVATAAQARIALAALDPCAAIDLQFAEGLADA